jgi:hypothetical protein
MTTPEQAAPYLPKQMGGGGSVHMTAPHALVNLLSGKVAAIAGEAGPETAKFDGAVIIDPNKDSTPTGYGDPVLPQEPLPPLGGVGTGAGALGTALGSPAPSVGAPAAAAAPAMNWTPADLQAMIAAANAANAAPPPVGQPAGAVGTAAAPAPHEVVAPAPPLPPQLTPQASPLGPALGPAAAPAPTLVPPPAPPPTPVVPPASPFELPTGVQPGPVTQTAPNPGPSPAPVVTPTNIPNPTPSFNIPDFLRQTPSGLGRTPKFLPENLASEDPIIAQMLQQGAFPPFLQRIFAQKQGLAGLGTNVPQQTDLPPGVPLVSKLAFAQMTPSEQAAFTSFISAHGLTPEDYFSMVEAASPQGGAGSTNPAIPQFLRQ